MKQLLLSLLIFGFGISGLLGQTIRTLGFNTTNGQVVANTGTNVLTFTNTIAINGTAQINMIEPYGGGSGISINDGLLVDTNGVGGEAFSWGSGVLAMGVPISFATTNVAATTRTNLGLGNGITTNRTFVSYNGTNYTTNSVSISNGVITGWTQ